MSIVLSVPCSTEGNKIRTATERGGKGLKSGQSSLSSGIFCEITRRDSDSGFLVGCQKMSSTTFGIAFVYLYSGIVLFFDSNFFVSSFRVKQTSLQ